MRKTYLRQKDGADVGAGVGAGAWWWWCNGGGGGSSGSKHKVESWQRHGRVTAVAGRSVHQSDRQSHARESDDASTDDCVDEIGGRGEHRGIARLEDTHQGAHARHGDRLAAVAAVDGLADERAAGDTVASGRMEAAAAVRATHQSVCPNHVRQCIKLTINQAITVTGGPSIELLAGRAGCGNVERGDVWWGAAT